MASMGQPSVPHGFSLSLIDKTKTGIRRLIEFWGEKTASRRIASAHFLFDQISAEVFNIFLCFIALAFTQQVVL